MFGWCLQERVGAIRVERCVPVARGGESVHGIDEIQNIYVPDIRRI